MTKLKKIYIEITNACNLACSFCKKPDRPQKFISAADFSLIINKIKPHTSYIYMHVLGEPLLHKELGILLDICEQNGIKASITTNATLLRSQIENIINKPALRQVNYSLHSLFEYSGDYKEILMNIYDFILAGGDTVYHCLRLWNLASADEYQNHLLTDELTRLFGAAVCFPKGVTAGHGVKIFNNVFMQQQQRFVWPSIDGEEIFNRGRCGGLRHDAGILVDGSVVPCCLDGGGDMVIGNIYQQSLVEILNS
jgi:sulfatase maturation enzyme AslB (radical SAM superfamily)